MDCTTDDFVYASDGEGLARNLRDTDGYLIMPEAILKSVGPFGGTADGGFDAGAPAKPA